LRQRTWGNQSLTGPSEPSSSSVAFEKTRKRIGGFGGSGKFKSLSATALNFFLFTCYNLIAEI
jgi:hypothetical protein